MRVPLAEVGRRGRLDLVFSLQNGRTVLRHSYCEVPFKITRLLNSRGSAAHLMLMQCTAGIFGGDDLECSIRVESGAAVRITQQSATKIHPSEGRLAKQKIHIMVESGAELQFLLEPVIPFAESSLKQTTRIDVQTGGRLMFWEAFMAGRVGRGERWRFTELASETCLYSDKTLLYLDRFQLRGGCASSRWAMGECAYMGTGLYAGPHAQRVASVLHQRMPGAGVDNPAADLAVVRAVLASGPEFHRCREMVTDSLETALSGQ
jgi:urease accessory protein